MAWLKLFWSWFYSLVGSPTIKTRQQLDLLQRNAFSKGMEKRQKLDAIEKREWCKKVWELYMAVDEEKTDTKKQQLIDTFFRGIK